MTSPEISPPPSSRIFYGWWVVITISVVIAIVWACSLWALPVFYTFWIAEFQWDRAAVAGAGGSVLLFTSACYPFAGAIMDKFGVKRVMILCVMLMGASLLGYAYLSSLWQLYFFSSFLGIGLAGTGIMTDQVLISKWFIMKRGLAVGITMAGIGVGATIGPQIALFLIKMLGWRTAFMAQGLSIWLLALPLLVIIIKEKPQDIGLLPDGGLEGNIGNETRARGGYGPTVSISFRDALRTRTLWLLSIASFLSFFVIFALINHLILYLKDVGYTLETASLALSVCGFFSFLGKIIFGRFLDVFHNKKNAIVVAYLLLVSGVLLLHFAGSAFGVVFISICSIGLAWGGSLVCMTDLTAYYFGLKYLGRILGFVMVFFGLSGALAPSIVGYVYQYSLNYEWALMLFILFSLVATVLVVIMRPPRSTAGERTAADSTFVVHP